MSAGRKLRDLTARDVDARNPLAIAAWCLSAAARLRRYGMSRGSSQAYLSTVSLILHGKILANLDPVRLETRLAELCKPDELRGFFHVPELPVGEPDPWEEAEHVREADYACFARERS